MFLLCVACTNSNDIIETSELSKINKNEVTSNNEKDVRLQEFASILSKVTDKREDVRAFLKAEAIKKFDTNYDILYCKVKDDLINGKTFREILVDYSSEKQISEIEATIPRLNIFMPRMKFLNVIPENYDTKDNTIPIAVSLDSCSILYQNGKYVDKIETGAVPGFQVLVVNENCRVITSPITRSNGFSYSFKKPIYDGGLQNQFMQYTRAKSDNLFVKQKMKDAYEYFHADDGSVYSKGNQRDYIYYGITPQNQTGALNKSVQEYLSFIEVDPKAYYTISDQNELSNGNDPFIKNTYASRKKKDFSFNELMDEMWTKGEYLFRVCVVSSNSDTPTTKEIILGPDDLWDFHLHRTYRHSTGIRHSRYTYWMDQRDFTAKRVPLENIALGGKWDISKEALDRRIYFYEVDEGTEITKTISCDFEKMNSNKFNGDIKLNVGLSKNVNGSGSIGGETSSSNTTKETKTITIKHSQKSDELGDAIINFYDPLIVEKTGSEYKMKVYSTGSVSFGISVY